MILLLAIINSIIISFNDLLIGKSFLLLICIILNIYISLLVNNVNNKINYLIILPVYVLFRQIFSIDFSKVEIDNFSFFIFYCYFLSFIFAYTSIIEKRKFITEILAIYIVLNFIFGIFDYIAIDIPFVHTLSNNSERFRGLSIEPTTLAVPLTLCMIGYYDYLKKYHLMSNKIIVIFFFPIVMIWLSGSKAAYTLVILYLLMNFLRKFKFLYIFIFSLTFIFILRELIIFGVLQNFTFFNNFILLINPEIIINEGIEPFIQYLSMIDQYQGGSFGTRLTTLYSSLSIIWHSPFFGFGEGLSYPYISDFIFSNNLENLELQDHLAYNPAFITDKTFIVKYLVDYGFIGLVILCLTYLKFIGDNISNKLTKIQYSMVMAFVILTQSQFVLVFATIYLCLTTFRDPRASDSNV